MKTKLLGILLLAGSSLFARSHFSIAVGVGGPVYPAYGYYEPPPVVVYDPPPPPVRYVAPPCPGPDYAWVDSYWYPSGPRWVRRGGYWARRPYARAFWVGPRYYRSRWYRGYWR